jgi:hypothetical protein
MKTLLSKGITSEIMISLLVLGLMFSSSLPLASQISKGRFSGVVYAVSGVPVINAIVVASGINGSGVATTDASGNYSISDGLLTGSYNLSVIATGYLLGNASAHVVAGQTTPGVDFYLHLSGAITGTVTDKNTTAPLKGVVVTAIGVNGTGSSAGFWSAITDASGQYTIATNLKTGTYNVTAGLFQSGYTSKEVKGIAVTEGSTHAGVDIGLEESGIIAGRITTFYIAVPLPGVMVSALYANYSLAGFATTNATGYYTISSGLTTDDYIVLATGYGQANQTYPVHVIEGQTTPNVNLWLGVTPPAASGIITGKVTDTGSKPIINALVRATKSGASGNAHTDTNGNYVISTGLTTGTYNVTASAAGYNSTTTTGVSVTVSQTTPNVDFQLNKIPPSQSGTIKGTVMGDQNAVPEFASPLLLLLTAIAVTAVFTYSKKKTVRKPE